MSEMVERVARALNDAINPGETTMTGLARIAIAAMREPTPLILQAMADAPGTYDEVWRAMIDAALSDGR